MAIPSPCAAFRLGSIATESLLRSGIIHQQKTVCIERFITSQYALVYIHSGEGYFEDDHKRRFPLHPGYLMQRFPSRRHEWHVRGETVYAYIGVPCQVYELFLSLRLVSPDKPVLAGTPDESILKWIARFTPELSSMPTRMFPEALLRMQAFMTKLLLKARGAEEVESGSDWIPAAAQRLAEDMCEGHSLPELARELGVGYAVFRKRFRDEMGVSPGEYRILRRMERAMELLATQQMPIKEVARLLGYASIYAFSAQFKKYHHFTPTQFRASLAEGHLPEKSS